MHRIWSWILAVFLLVTGSGSAGAELRISEALSAPATDWNGDGVVDFKTDEWVEIVNAGSAPENLEGVYLRDGTGSTYHYGFSGSLLPGEVLVVFGSDALAWQIANSAGTSGLSLNNSGDRVELWRELIEPIVLDPLDVVEIPAHAAATDRAIALEPTTGLLVLHDALSPYSGTLLPGGTGCEPSPGLSNDCAGNVPLEPASLGELKIQYEN